MANTTNNHGGIIEITGLDADWYLSNDLSAYAATGILLHFILFIPSAAEDILHVKNSAGGVATHPTLYYKQAESTYDTQPFNLAKPKRCWPFIDISACTFATAANARVIIGYEP